VAVFVLLLWPAVRGVAQRSGTTSLVLRVAPEVRLSPQQVALHFRVSAEGASDVTTESAVIAAWVRALPGQQIRMTSRLENLQGPDGPVPASAVRWAGSTRNATGGGRQAECTSGVFAAGAVQDMVQGWDRSGILTCAVSFELAEARSLPPGQYSGVVSLAVEGQ